MYVQCMFIRSMYVHRRMYVTCQHSIRCTPLSQGRAYPELRGVQRVYVRAQYTHSGSRRMHVCAYVRTHTCVHTYSLRTNAMRRQSRGRTGGGEGVRERWREREGGRECKGVYVCGCFCVVFVRVCHVPPRRRAREDWVSRCMLMDNVVS
jgi:hypothetical protein